jgi:hypothetical protein
LKCSSLWPHMKYAQVLQILAALWHWNLWYPVRKSVSMMVAIYHASSIYIGYMMPLNLVNYY